MSFQLKPKPVGLAARIAQTESAQNQTELAATPKTNPIIYLAVTDPAIKDKIGIIFDDSGSMGGQPLQEAKDGIIEFLRSCVPNQTAVAIYPLKDNRWGLETNIPYIASKVLEIRTQGSTPLVQAATDMISQVPITRMVAFSDGAPDSYVTEELVSKCKAKSVAIDTCFIGSELDTRAIEFMRKLAEDTGGLFVHLKPGVSIRNTFKYLAPAYRGLLTDKSFLDKVEKGQV